MNIYKLKMKNNLKAILSAILILLISGQVEAQSIDSLVNEAIANNPQLKSLQSRIAASEYRSESVDYLPPPNVAVEFSQVPVDIINVWAEAISNSLSLSQMFPLGGKLSAMNNVELQSVEVTKKDYEYYKTNLTAQVKMSYYYIWQLERKIEIQGQNIDLPKQSAEFT